MRIFPTMENISHAMCSPANDDESTIATAFGERHIRCATAVNVDGGEFAKWSRRKSHGRFADRDA